MKKLFALVSIATLMFSCSENIGESTFDEKLPINISVDVQTRANDTTFESGDAVGIYVVNYDGTTAGTLKAEGNQADNAEFTYNGSWNSDEPIYWKDKNTSADFYAYYPYSASVNIAKQPFAVQEDQSSEANFWASDFLWGKTVKVAPTSNAVNIQTNHVLSRIIVEIKPGSGFTSASWAAASKSVKICDVKTNATINLATGVATATGNISKIIPLATSSNYKAMIVPQTIADDSKLIVVTVDGTEYVYRTGYTFKANTQHNFSIVVDKNESSVSVSIGEWDIDSTVNQGVAVEEESETTTEFNPNHCIYYKKNKTGGWDSGMNNYVAVESSFDGASGAVVEMKFKMQKLSGSNRAYLGASSNLAKDNSDEFYITQESIEFYVRLAESSDYHFSYKWADIGVNYTDLITLRLSSVDKTITINDKVFENDQIGYLGWSYLFSSYYRERDEGLWDELEGIPNMSELYYVKMYDTDGNLTYFGHAAKETNPETGNIEYCWYSNKNGAIAYEFAHNAAEMGGFGGNF